MDHRNDSSHDIQIPHISIQPDLEDVLTLLNIVNKEDVGFDEISTAMQSKTMIAAVMTRTANSVGLGAVQQVRSLRHALALIGLHRIRELLQEMKIVAITDRSRVAS